MGEVRTWHLELATVAGVLASVPVEWLGTGAVVLSFAHAQVADRLSERQAIAEQPSVSCFRWEKRYFLGKECLWCLYFTAHGSWAALAGVAMFLAYPAWRRWWRTRRPIGRPVKAPQ